MCWVWMPAEPRRSACWPTSRGTVVAEARRGGANLQASGELEVEKVLHDVMEEAIGDRPDRPGGDLPRDRRRRSAGRLGGRPRDHETDRPPGARAGRQRRAGGARGRRARAAWRRGDLGDRIDLLRTQRRGRGGPIGRVGLRARRRGQRLLDRPGGAARGPARVGQPRTADGAVRPAAAALRRRARPGADPRGLQREPEAGGDRRARPVRPDGFLRGGSRVAIGILRAAANELEAAALSVARRLESRRPAVRVHPRRAASFARSRGSSRSSSAGCRSPLPSAACSCSIASRPPGRSRSRCRKRVAAPRSCL